MNEARDPGGRVWRLGTRRSALAMAQSRQVAEAVHQLTGHPVELVEITTRGDTSREHLSVIGGAGVFVSALRDALLAGAIDIAVHSMKDLPTAAPDGLVLAAVPAREDPSDVLVARDGLTLAGLAELPNGARIGTGSLRRVAQINAWARSIPGRPAIEMVPIRGNVDTRIGYVRSGKLDAVVLARAGLARLGRLDEVTEVLRPDLVLPAPGQGALAIECRADTSGGRPGAARTTSGGLELAAQLARLDDPITRIAVTAERSLLAALEAGCSAPVGALADAVPGVGAAPFTELCLRGVVGATDGSSLVQLSATGSILVDGVAPGSASGEGTAAALGRDLAAEMLAKGAAGLMGEREQ